MGHASSRRDTDALNAYFEANEQLQKTQRDFEAFEDIIERTLAIVHRITRPLNFQKSDIDNLPDAAAWPTIARIARTQAKLTRARVQAGDAWQNIPDRIKPSLIPPATEKSR